MIIETSAPGRICLFGEHQDYMMLPVITSAIDLRVKVTGQPIDEKIIRIIMPDIDSEEIIDFSSYSELEYIKERDYFKSMYNILFRMGMRLEHGYECTIRGNIPINSGTSSSSALLNAWCLFLIKASDVIKEYDDSLIAKLAHEAEVTEFGEPGGMMDHYASALGGVQFIEFSPVVKPFKLDNSMGTFVLGDSKQPKDTVRILSGVKNRALDAVKKIREIHSDFSIKTAPIEIINDYKQYISGDEFRVLTGMILNRDYTVKAKNLFEEKTFNHKKFGKLLYEHHNILDMYLHISTDKINNMIESAIKAGAYGGKINGSGGGGCMFVYAPENPELAAEAILSAGGEPFIIKNGKGVI